MNGALRNETELKGFGKRKFKHSRLLMHERREKK